MARRRKGGSVEVHGAKELARALETMRHDVEDLEPVNRSALEIIARRAKVNAPRVSGRLAGSVRVEVRDKLEGVVIAGGRMVPYAGVIQYGWDARNIEAQPFLTDAADESRDDVEREYDRYVDKLVDRVERQTPP